jgi:hypothetical protein
VIFSLAAADFILAKMSIPGGIAMNLLLVTMVALIWFLMSHHSLFVHAP